MDFLPLFSKGHDFHLLFICCRWLVFLSLPCFFVLHLSNFLTVHQIKDSAHHAEVGFWLIVLWKSLCQGKKKSMPAQISYFTELIGFDVEPAVHYKCSYVMKCSGLSYSCHNPMCQGADTICILVRCHKFDKMGVLEPWQ